MAAEFVSDPFRLRNCATGKYLCIKGKRNKVELAIVTLISISDLELLKRLHRLNALVSLDM